MQWTLFCHVIDNFGDVGVCWRLANELARRGQTVRLVIDDPRALAWMAPGGAANVSLHAGPEALPPGDVVVEAFGFEPPPAFINKMANSNAPPLWINLEYLSAQSYVERSHGLLSPHSSGLNRWFFYPGFNPRTGGLLREPGLLQRRAAWDGRAWLAERGWAAQPAERVVSLFCYDNPRLPALLKQLDQAATLLLLTPGPAQQQVRALRLLTRLAGGAGGAGGLRLLELPWLSQHDFDHLLWASDVNFVRGEDSLVRAIWAGVPWVWQAYPQHDGAHHAKVEALLSAQGASPAVAAFWRAWNGAGPALPALPDTLDWGHRTLTWREQLASQPSLADALLAFVQRHGSLPQPDC